jgi:hypothetical protein
MLGRPLWMIFLGLWFLLYGVFALTNITVLAAHIVMGVLAILVAVFVFVNK